MTKENKPNRKKLNPIRFLVFLIVIIFVMAAVSGLGLMIVSIKDLPAFNEAKLIPASATLIFDKDGKQTAQIGLENRLHIPINDVPEHVQEAFLAAEDHYFYDHHGIRIKAIIRATYNDALRFIGKDRNLQGASTITQQLVKLSFLTPERTLKRKVQEAILALQLERRYSKTEILEMYLNRIYLGEGTYGIQAAAQRYFGKSAGDLTVGEAAMLAGITRSPNNYSPFRNIETATNLRNKVLDNMHEYNMLDQTTCQQEKSKSLELASHDKTANPYPYPYFLDYVIEQLVDQFGEEMVFKGGLKVYTTLDPNIQSYAEKAMNNAKNFPATKANKDGLMQPQGAMVVLDPANGAIRAVVGGREHTHMRALNRATMSIRQPGSVIKPVLVYAPAVDLLGMGPATILNDTRVTYAKYQNYRPNNYDGVFRGLITMRTAISISANIPAVRVFTDSLNMTQGVEFANKLGLDYKITGPAMALGSQEVTVLQLAGAYAAFANGGIYHKPMAISRVYDRTGNLIYEAEEMPYRAMKETTAYLITDMLRTVVQSGTGTRAAIANWPVAGKTGTTDEQKDIWFAGYTPELVSVVWIGYDMPAKMPHSYGGIYPAGIWREVMQQAHQGLNPRSFTRPEGIVTQTVSRWSGLLPGHGAPPEHLVTDLFAAGTVPTEVDNSYVLIEVCATSGKLPSPNCEEIITQSVLRNSITETCDVHDPDNHGGTKPPGSPDPSRNGAVDPGQVTIVIPEQNP